MLAIAFTISVSILSIVSLDNCIFPIESNVLIDFLILCLLMVVMDKTFANESGSLTLAHSQNSQMSFMYGFFFVKFLFYTVVCVVIVI